MVDEDIIRGGLRLVTRKRKKKPVQSKNRARPMAARLKKKPRAEQEPRSAHGRAVNKTIIRFGFCDIQNNQGLGKGYQPQP